MGRETTTLPDTDPHAAFLRDVCAAPENMVPRLIYAAWLQEHGGPAGAARSEFIRAQCELDARPGFTARWRKLYKRTMTLQRKHKTLWLRPLREWSKFCRFRRGFVEEMTLFARGFLRRGHLLFRETPLRRVKFVALDRGKKLDLSEFAACPHLARLREISLGKTNLNAEGARTLASCAHLAGLTWLGLEPPVLDPDAVAALGGSPHLARLRELYLSGWELNPSLQRGDEVARAVAGGSAFARLVVLNLAGRNVGDAGLLDLANAPVADRLRTLVLDDSPRLSAAGFDGLAGRDAFPRLRSLSLNRCAGLDEKCLRSLAGWPGLSRLVELRLAAAQGSGAKVTDAGVRALAASPHLARLRCLDLRGQDISDAGAAALVEAPALGRLEFLDLRWMRVGKEMQEALRKRFGRGVCEFSREPRDNGFRPRRRPAVPDAGSVADASAAQPRPVVRAASVPRPQEEPRRDAVWEDDIPF
jgi:uncharacterized protein (TIGR02996 family)